MTPLRQRLTDDLTLRNRSPETIREYVHVVAQYAKHFGRSPDQLGSDELAKYLLHLKNERRVAQGTYNLHMAALRFFYRTTLDRPEIVASLASPRPNGSCPWCSAARRSSGSLRRSELEAPSDLDDGVWLRPAGIGGRGPAACQMSTASGW